MMMPQEKGMFSNSQRDYTLQSAKYKYHSKYNCNTVRFSSSQSVLTWMLQNKFTFRKKNYISTEYISVAQKELFSQEIIFFHKLGYPSMEWKINDEIPLHSSSLVEVLNDGITFRESISTKKKKRGGGGGLQHFISMYTWAHCTVRSF